MKQDHAAPHVVAAPQTKSPFASVSLSFFSTMNALRVFADRIGPVAASHDADTCEPLKQEIEQIFGTTIGELAATTEDSSPSTGAPEQRQLTQPQAMRLLRKAREFTYAPPMHVGLLVNSVLIALVSELDALVERIARMYYSTHPDAIPKEHSISFAELRALPDLAAAEDLVVDHVLDKLMRESIETQLKRLSCYGLVLSDSAGRQLPRIVELTQRRHLLVHNDGIVNRRYIRNVEPGLVAELGVAMGEPLRTTREYLMQAIDRAQVFGAVLVQLAWRKWDPENVPEADNSLNDHVFYAVESEQYCVASGLADFGVTVPMLSEVHKRNLALNLAQAHKWNGDGSQMEAAIALHDWSACSPKYQLAIHALHDDVDGFVGWIPRAVGAQDIDHDSFMNWPIFKQMRAVPRVMQTINGVFGLDDETQTGTGIRPTASAGADPAHELEAGPSTGGLTPHESTSVKQTE